MTKLPIPVFLLAFCAAGCEQPTREPPPPPVVIVAKPEVQEVRPSFVFVGTTEAAEFVEVRARVQGFLESVDFEPGDNVEAGTPLFKIQPDEFESAVERARATLAVNEAELSRAEADLARVREAVKTNAVSQQEVGLRQADADKAAAMVESAKADLRRAELDLGYTTITAPIAGKVSRELVTQGNLVGAGGQNTLLTTIAAHKPIYVYFEIPERVLVERLRSPEGRRNEVPIHVQLEGDDGYPHEGVIDFFENRADPATGTVKVRGVLPNEDLTVYPGLFARVRIEGLPMPNTVVVEETAIGTDLGGKFVYVIGEGNVVERRYLTLGDEFEGKRAVLDGLEPDATYIVEGMIRARPGLPVRPMTREEAAAAQQQAGARER